jgi:CxxC motif-containing protein
MTGEFVCIICPTGCVLTAKKQDSVLEVEGNQCEQGIAFAEQEANNPQRILTTTIKLTTGELLPVRSNGTVKRDELRELVRYLRSVSVAPPIEIGQVIAAALGANCVDIIATDNTLEFITDTIIEVTQ